MSDGIFSDFFYNIFSWTNSNPEREKTVFHHSTYPRTSTSLPICFAMCEVHVVAGSYAHVLFGYDFVVPSEGNATVVPRSVLALCAHPHQGYLLLYTFFLFAHVLRPLFCFPALPFFFPFPSLYPLPYPTNCAMNNMVFHTPCLVTYKTVVNIISSTEHNKLGYSNGFLSLLKFLFHLSLPPCHALHTWR